MWNFPLELIDNAVGLSAQASHITDLVFDNAGA